MGNWKLLLAQFTALDTIRGESGASGHSRLDLIRSPRRCSLADSHTKSLSSATYGSFYFFFVFIKVSDCVSNVVVIIL